MADQHDLLTEAETAARLRITPRGLRYRREQGCDVPARIRVGKQWLYPRRLVEEYIRQLEERAAAGA